LPAPVPEISPSARPPALRGGPLWMRVVDWQCGESWVASAPRNRLAARGRKAAVGSIVMASTSAIAASLGSSTTRRYGPGHERQRQDGRPRGERQACSSAQKPQFATPVDGTLMVRAGGHATGPPKRAASPAFIVYYTHAPSGMRPDATNVHTTCTATPAANDLMCRLLCAKHTYPAHSGLTTASSISADQRGFEIGVFAEPSCDLRRSIISMVQPDDSSSRQ